MFSCIRLLRLRDAFIANRIYSKINYCAVTIYICDIRLEKQYKKKNWNDKLKAQMAEW